MVDHARAQENRLGVAHQTAVDQYERLNAIDANHAVSLATMQAAAAARLYDATRVIENKTTTATDRAHDLEHENTWLRQRNIELQGIVKALQGSLFVRGRDGSQSVNEAVPVPRGPGVPTGVALSAGV